ncbi:ATP-binding protein [bacterium]|nr:ATP-binding protein [bacterium]
MKKTFIKTKNVKNFVALMEELKNLPPNMSKIALVYGEYGLGKTQTIQWWAARNDAVYVRAARGMTESWLLSKMAEDLDIIPSWHSQSNYEYIEKSLLKNPKVIIVDEVDYLLKQNIIEILRDLHDTTKCPLVLVGMENIERRLSALPHLCDRIYKSYKFTRFDAEDIKLILQQLSELSFTPDGIEYLVTRENQFRQIIKLVNRIENLANTNQIKILDEDTLKGLLNERPNLKVMP